MIWFEAVRVLRRLRQAPRFSAAVIASIGIAVGPILTASSAFEAVFLRNTAAKASHQLFAIRSVGSATGGSNPSTRGLSFPDYQDLRADLPTDSWRYMTAWKVQDVSRVTPGGDQPMRIAAISGDYFRIANARFVQGYSPAEPEAGAVVTRALWRELTARGDTTVLTIYNQQYPVVGVVDDSFRGLLPNEGIDAWIPLTTLPRLDAELSLLSYRELEDLSVLVQATAGAGRRSLQPPVALISAHLSEFHDGYRYGWHLAVTRAQPGFLELLRTTRGQSTLASLVVLLCVLLIAATNIANLFVIRAAARESELQLQLALGIPKRHLLLYECLEPVVLGLAGLVLGLCIGTIALHDVAAIPALERLRLRSSTVSMIAACGTALFFVAVCALMPAMRLSRLREAHMLHQGQGITSHGVSWLQRSYLVIQFTLALGFTCVAVQLASAVRQQSTVNVGFDTKNLLVITGATDRPGRTPAERLSDYDRVTAAVSSIRGVVAVSASVAEFFGGYRMARRPLSTLPSSGRSSDRMIVSAMDVVGPGYFAALGLPVRAGRAFGDDDRLGMPPSIIVNQTLARLVAGSRQPIGMTLYESGTYPLQIIGVVPDVRATAAEQAQPVYYRSLTQSPLPSFVLYARVAAPSFSYRVAIAAAIVKEYPESVGRIQINTAEEQRRHRDLPAIAMFWLSTGLAALAMLIAGLGLYGVASYAALTRRREHGIRAALGASPRQLAAMVFGEGLGWTVAGVALSVPFVMVGMKVATAVVVGVRHIAVLTTITLLVLYVLVVFLALTLPAYRVASVSPSDALRSL